MLLDRLEIYKTVRILHDTGDKRHREKSCHTLRGQEMNIPKSDLPISTS